MIDFLFFAALLGLVVFVCVGIVETRPRPRPLPRVDPPAAVRIVQARPYDWHSEAG